MMLHHKEKGRERGQDEVDPTRTEGTLAAQFGEGRRESRGDSAAKEVRRR